MNNLLNKPVIAVIGAGGCTPSEAEHALQVGREIARRGAILICGGLGGCMAEAARGAKEAGGITIGIIPTYDKPTANEFIDIVIATGMGHARNAIIVATADAAIAVGGSYGTLSEIALARKMGKPVVSLGSWQFAGDWEELSGVFRATDPIEAVDIAIREALR
jgi:hypothetical protein